MTTVWKIRDLVLREFNERPGVEMNAERVQTLMRARGLPEKKWSSRQNISTALASLQIDGKLARMQHGVYQLVLQDESETALARQVVGQEE